MINITYGEREAHIKWFMMIPDRQHPLLELP